MKKGMLVVVALLVGVMVCSAALARKITGHVYFDTAKMKPARCSDVYLWNNATCSGGWGDMTTVNAAGYYEFTGLDTGTYYSVKAEWGLVICVQCDTSGTECDTPAESQCLATPNDSSDATIDLVFDIDCECEGD